MLRCLINVFIVFLFQAIRRRKNVASSNKSSIPLSTDVNGNPHLPPCLSPIPPPIAAIPRCRYPPPLTPIEPVSNVDGTKSKNTKLTKHKAAGMPCAPTGALMGRPNQKLSSSSSSTSNNKVVREKNCALLKPVLRNGKSRKCPDISELKSKAVRTLNNNNYAKLKKSHKVNPNRLPGRKKVAKPVDDKTTFEPPMLRNKRKIVTVDGIFPKISDYKRRKLQEMTEKPSLKLLRNSKQCLQKKLRNHVRATVNSIALNSKHKHVNNHIINNNTLEMLPLDGPASIVKPILTDPEINAPVLVTAKRGRGRPPGSKNKLLRAKKNKQRPTKSTSVACACKSKVTGQGKAPSHARVAGPTISTTTASHNAPVFFPSQEEWKDPIAYITSISAQVAPSGMCKVVPPKGWMVSDIFILDFSTT